MSVLLPKVTFGNIVERGHFFLFVSISSGLCLTYRANNLEQNSYVIWNVLPETTCNSAENIEGKREKSNFSTLPTVSHHLKINTIISDTLNLYQTTKF